MESRVGSFGFHASNAKVISARRFAIGQIIFGAVLIALFVLFAFTGLEFHYDESGIAEWFTFSIMGLLMLCMGVSLIVFGVRKLHSVRHFRRYVSVLQKDETGSIRRLSSALGENYSDTLRHLHKYAGRGYFCNAIIDDNLEIIKFPDRIRKYSDAGYQTTTCIGCGATRLLPKGTIVRCEYCGHVMNIAG